MMSGKFNFIFLKKLIAILVVFFVIFVTSGFAQVVSAQSEYTYGIFGPFACGTSPGSQNECHSYEYLKSLTDKTMSTWRFAIVMGILNTFQSFSQHLASDAADWILSGGTGKKTAFEGKTFVKYLADNAIDASNQMLSSLNKFSAQEWGFDICKPMSLSLKLSLGLGAPPKVPAADCTFLQVVTNFQNVYRSMQPEELQKSLLQMLEPGGNDIAIQITGSQKFMEKLSSLNQGALMQRVENKGLKSVLGFINGQIKTPAVVVQETIANSNAFKILYESDAAFMNAQAGAALVLGAVQLPILAGATFVNQLATGALQKFFDAMGSIGAEDPTVLADLENPDTQSSSNQGNNPISVTDFLFPNLMSSDKQDFTYELSSCPSPRGPWGCSMDDGMMTGLHLAEKDGGNTVARAAGIGVKQGNPSSIYLHKDWELIPEWESKDNQDTGCYQRAYCASNLSKLRFARILSIGWELAANSPFNKKLNGKYVTLETVVQNFSNCNADGQADSGHPWCHLINPGWVLTAPQFTCKIRGFGDSLLAPDTSVRTQECTDVVSCLASNDKGECIGGYGYCLSEKTAWRFGADQCEEKFVSCRTYQPRDKSIPLSEQNPTGASSQVKAVSYIRNTIDYGACSADNVGCLYYYALRDTSTSSTDRWITEADKSTDLWRSTYAGTYENNVTKFVSPRVYFDGSVQKCDAANDGCTKMYNVVENQPALNLIRNGSFEDLDPKDAKKLIGWQKYALISVSAENGATIQDGSRSAQFDKASVNAEIAANIGGLRNYVVSYYVRKAGVGAASSNLKVTFSGLNGAKIDLTNTYATSTNCDKSIKNGAIGITPKADSILENWQRFTCEFVSPKDATVGLVSVGGSNVVIDSVELEEGTNATEYLSGVNASLSTDFLKIAPDELKCAENSTTTRAQCAKYARACNQTDVKCQGYTDVNGGRTEIPATLNEQDRCPNSCVGYAEYRKLPSAFDLTKDHAPLDDPKDDMIANFVPKAAKQCSAAAVGCDEFTNVESQAAGGEQKIYLTYVRACEKPGKDPSTYFTWEGSDTTGYQLRTWSLMMKVANDPADSLYQIQTTAPRIILKAGPSGIVKDPVTCTETTWKTGFDPDCRQFYDEQGAAYYRYFSQTVLSSLRCTDYRKNDSDKDDCTKTGGAFNAATNECIYKVEVAQSNTCSNVDAACRGYIGTTGRNTATVISENFAAPSSTGAFYDVDKSTKIKSSNEALLVGDHSLQLSAKGNVSVGIDFAYSTGSLYTVSFWAKSPLAGQGDKLVTLSQFLGKKPPKPLGSAVLSADWKRYEMGPFTMDSAVTSTLIFGSTSDQTYFDTIDVQRLQDIVYVRKNTWVIPAECDQTLSGIPQPQAMLGCREYTDRKGRIVDVRQFSHLCRYEAIGCSAYVNSRDSLDSYGEVFALKGIEKPAKNWDNLYAGTVTTIHPADRYEYLIDEPSAHCDAAQATCRSFGQPVFDVNQAVSSTQVKTVYLMDDVTKYADVGGEPKMLCRPSELFCEQYSSKPPTGAVTSYFREPGLHTCEWKDKVQMKSGDQQIQTSGWFEKDVDPPTPCYPKKVSSGNTYLFAYAGVSEYTGWTATCPKEQAECTEFRDPSDHTDQVHPQGKPYFYIDNNKIDRSTCGNKVDLFSGCVLFRNMNDSQTIFSSPASYAASTAADNTAVPVINCEKDPGNAFCKGVSRCVNWKAVMSWDVNPNPAVTQEVMLAKHKGEEDAKTCSVDADCGIFDGDPQTEAGWRLYGNCQVNDSNLVLKVKLDRDCTTWLGCTTAETTYDPAQGKYIDLCTTMSACDQSLGATGKNFCAHYVDRNPMATKLDTLGYKEPVLNQGVFLDYSTYTHRPVGFNVPDYSSYALPNHFQMSDLMSRKVAMELLINRKGPQRDKFYSDYRLVAAVKMYEGATTANGHDDMSSLKFAATLLAYNSDPAAAIRYTDPKFPDLNLCQHKQTGRIGYYNTFEEVVTKEMTTGRCYFAIDNPYSQSGAEVLGAGAFNIRDIQSLATEFGQVQPIDAMLDSKLVTALPAAECRAYPDASAPFPNNYVKEWDNVSDPPKPKVFVDGYDKIPYCEQGEDCSCSYRKVSYDAVVNKYYTMFGSPPPSGICSGGDRDGQSCVPGASAATPGSSTPDQAAPTDPKKNVIVEAGGSPAIELCGTGSCTSIQTVSFVRGQFGQCLERDMSRNVAGSQDQHPCLIWNPPPVLFGQKDQYHYMPTAAYIPPQNAGAYYCLSPASLPKIASIDSDTDTDHLLGAWIPKLPGSLDKFYYSEDFVSDGQCAGCEGNSYDDYRNSKMDFIDNVRAVGGQMGADCENADHKENKASTAGIDTETLVDKTAGRWIMTGRGKDKNYAEYFIPLNEKRWAGIVSPQEATSPSDNAIRNALMESNFAFFKWSPMMNPNGRGLMGCARSADWVDGVDIKDYTDVQQLTDGDKAWLSGFLNGFNGRMTRESANFLTTLSDEKVLQPVTCMDPKNNPSGSKCYYKFWQIGYQDNGKQKFVMEGATNGQKFDPQNKILTKSEAGKAFFSIRAMFEDTNISDNAKPADQIVDPNELSGPFRFVGWWVTASSPGAVSESVIYMDLQIGSLSTCTEVGRTVALDSGEATAFNDRIWENGQFSVPLLGFVYSTLNTPFSSAMHTRLIGTDPLFQTHGKVPGTYSKLKPPGFIASGFEYVTGNNLPKGNWASLNNIFARVYQIYRYYDRAVTEGSKFCVTGPHAGSFCTQATAPEDCGLIGVCDRYSGDPLTAPAACNSLSGVNSGLACSKDLGDELTGYHVCHNAPMMYNSDAVLTPQYTKCSINAAGGWSVKDGIPVDKNNPQAPSLTEEEAYLKGVWRCAKGAVKINKQDAPCHTTPYGKETQEEAHDCPVEVRGDLPISTFLIEDKEGTLNNKGVPTKGGGWAINNEMLIKRNNLNNGDEMIHTFCNPETHLCQGFAAECKYDIQCQFTQTEWWGKDKATKPWGYDVSADPDRANPVHAKDIAAHAPGYPIRQDSNIKGYEELFDHSFAYDAGDGSDSGDNGDGYCGESEDSGDCKDLTVDGVTTYMGYGDDRLLASTRNYASGNQWRNLATAGNSWWQSVTSKPYMAPANTPYPHGPGDAADGQDIGGMDLLGGGFVRTKATGYPYNDGKYDENSDWGFINNVDLLTSDYYGQHWASTYGGANDYPTVSFPSQYPKKDAADGYWETPMIMDRFPGAYAAAIVVKHVGNGGKSAYYEPARFNIFIPGHCERPPRTQGGFNEEVAVNNPLAHFDVCGDKDGSQGPGCNTADEDKARLRDSVDRTANNDQPYSLGSWFCDSYNKDPKENFWCEFAYDKSHVMEYNKWNHYQRFFSSNEGGVWTVGSCKGGTHSGMSCRQESECRPAGITQSDIDATTHWCQDVPTVEGCKYDQDTPTKDQCYYIDTKNNNTPVYYYKMCFPDNVKVGDPKSMGYPKSSDPDKDANLCTHKAGYYPRTDLCGYDLSRSECLTGYNLVGGSRKESVDPAKSWSPTDVTAGLYRNNVLAKGLKSWNYSPASFAYTGDYVPRPPQIAAPDTSHGCGSGQCPISKVGVFSLEGQTEGPLNYFGGQSVITMRFYAWAADNQGALTNMLIDWGDGTVQKIQDAKMKNKKPFCVGQSECTLVPGLTCATDADCPPGSGSCATAGFCKSRTYLSCTTDADCDYYSSSYGKDSATKVHDDTCVSRLTFGNSDLACEQNFFEFTHAYTCGKDKADPTNNCVSESYCSRDNKQACSAKNPCWTKDACIKGLAKPGGCFDAPNKSCRFTPRILIEDNWGWCTGECRTDVNASGNFIDKPLGSANILYKNGGCYDGSKMWSNIDSSKKLIGDGTDPEAGNSCNPDIYAGSAARPWIVYPGAVNLGVSQ